MVIGAVTVQDLKDIASIAGGVGTGILALIAIAAAIPKIQNGLIARIGKAFTRETTAAIASLETTVKSNHVEGLERFAKMDNEIKSTKSEVSGIAETLDTVAVMEQHTRRTLNGHLRSGRHLPKTTRGGAT